MSLAIRHAAPPGLRFYFYYPGFALPLRGYTSSWAILILGYYIAALPGLKLASRTMSAPLSLMSSVSSVSFSSLPPKKGLLNIVAML